MTEPALREPDDIRRHCARKLRGLVITPDGHLLGRCEGEAAFKAYLGASADLLNNIHGVAEVAELDGDEIGYLVGKVAEIKRRR